MDLNFTIVSGGGFELYLRYWPGRSNYLIGFRPEAGYELGKPYQVTIRVKGKRVELSQPVEKPQIDKLSVAVGQTGGVGFALHPGDKVVISSCKIKVLR